MRGALNINGAPVSRRLVRLRRTEPIVPQDSRGCAWQEACFPEKRPEL